MKQVISVVVPCYNEEKNVEPMYEAVKAQFEKFLPGYEFELLFIDNKSNDDTRDLLRGLCSRDKRVKAIFNLCNFGQFNSPYYALCQSTGVCTILLCADFQDPVELLPKMVQEWEAGNKVVCMIKTSSRESSFWYFLRTIYYKTIQKMSTIRQIEHFTGFGLYDRSFINVLRHLHEVTPFLRGIVAEYAPDHVEISYEQRERRAGISSNNFFTLFDAAMLSFTSYTKSGMRLATFGGFFTAGLSAIAGLFYLMMKLCFWNQFAIGNAPMLIGLFFIGGVQLCFLGLLGEYVMAMNTRIMRRPLVVEEERINF